MVFGSSLAQIRGPIVVPFCADHQKSKFFWILALFLLEAVEASPCYLFETRMSKPPEAASNIIKKKDADPSTAQSHLVSLVSI